MADIKISELSQAESLSLSDLMESAIPYNGGFQSRRMSLAQLSNYLENSVLHNALDTTAKNIIGAINEIVLDLANYYTTSQTYSKTEVDTLIAGVSGLHFKVEQTLPVTDIDPNTIYLVPKQDVGTQDIYDEFIYIVEEAPTPSHWEKIGTTEIDLSDYVTDTELATILNDYVTTSGLNTILTNYATTSAMTTALADKVDKVQGKGLSTEDYTTVEKAKLNGIESGAQVNDHKVAFENVSSNPPSRAVILIKDADDISGNSYPQFDAGSLFYYPTISEWRLGNIHFRGEEELESGGTGEFVKVHCRNSGRYKDYNLSVDMNLSDNNDVDVKLPSSSGQLALQSDIPTDFAVSRELMTEDLNDVKTVGFYVGKSGNTCTNKPNSDIRQFGLIVIKTATNGNYYKQTLIRPIASGEAWSRSCVNGTWSAWTQEIATDENVKQVNDTTSTAFPLLLANSNTDTTETSGVKKNLGVTFQPSNGALRMARPHTSTTTQDQQIVIGNNIENGTSGSVRGVISLYPKGSAWTKLFASEASETRNYFLPKDRPNNSEIAVTSDLASYNGLGAKNLLPMKTYNQSGYTSNGATFIVNDDGTVTVNRSTTSGIAQFYITNNTVNGGLWLPNGTYYLSGCPEGGSTSTYELGVRYVKNGSTLNTINDTGSGTTFTIDGSDYSNDGAWVRITLILRANVSASNMLWKPMVMFDSVADKSFAPPALTNRRLTTDKLDASEIATVENTDNASQAYAVGDYMVWRGGFYRVTVAISSGGAISTSNVTNTTIGAELKRALT